MKDEKILTASEVLKMLERPVVIAYGRETFNRLLKTQKHTLICTYDPEDLGVLKWCADFLQRRKGIDAYFDYEKTKYGQPVCSLVVGVAGWWFIKAGYYRKTLIDEHDFLTLHMHVFPPEIQREVKTITWNLRNYITQLEDEIIYGFEDAYNTHLWKPTHKIEYVCESIKYLKDEIDDYLYSDKVAKRIDELHQYIQTKGGER
jgi:hypothetical protein